MGICLGRSRPALKQAPLINIHIVANCHFMELDHQQDQFGRPASFPNVAPPGASFHMSFKMPGIYSNARPFRRAHRLEDSNAGIRSSVHEMTGQVDGSPWTSSSFRFGFAYTTVRTIEWQTYNTVKIRSADGVNQQQLISVCW